MEKNNTLKQLKIYALAVAIALTQFQEKAIDHSLASSSKSSNLKVHGNWGLSNKKSSHISAQKAWSITKGNKNVIVAVIDTGIDANHPDLKKNIWKKPNNNSTYGWDFTKGKSNPKDTNSHGTHVAGIIGGSFNKIKTQEE